jgi:hypothetical protein
MPCGWKNNNSPATRSAGCNSIARPVLGMAEIIPSAEKTVKLFMGHYTSNALQGGSSPHSPGPGSPLQSYWVGITAVSWMISGSDRIDTQKVPVVSFA